LNDNIYPQKAFFYLAVAGMSRRIELNNVRERTIRQQKSLKELAEEFTKRLILIDRAYKTVRGFSQAVERHRLAVTNQAIVTYRGKKPLYILDDVVIKRKDHIEHYIPDLLAEEAKKKGISIDQALFEFLEGRYDTLIQSGLLEYLTSRNQKYPCRTTVSALRIIWHFVQDILFKSEELGFMVLKVVKVDDESKRILVKGLPMNIMLFIEYKNKPPPAFLNTRYFEKFGVKRFEDYMLIERDPEGRPIAYQLLWLLTHPNIVRVYASYNLGVPEMIKNISICSFYIIPIYRSKSIYYKDIDWSSYIEDILYRLRKVYRL